MPSCKLPSMSPSPSFASDPLNSMRRLRPRWILASKCASYPSRHVEAIRLWQRRGTAERMEKETKHSAEKFETEKWNRDSLKPGRLPVAMVSLHCSRKEPIRFPKEFGPQENTKGTKSRWRRLQSGVGSFPL